MKYKICTNCNIKKPNTRKYFYYHKDKKLKSKCILCEKEYSKKYGKDYYFKNKNKVKIYCKRNKNKIRKRQIIWEKRNKKKVLGYKLTWYLKAIYNITHEQYDKMLKQQKGKCAICRKPNLKGKRLCIDHNHKTGKVRGLLCDRCNLIVGMIEAYQIDVNKYLRKFEK